MPFELRNLKILRGSFVDKGANQNAHVILFKREPFLESLRKLDAMSGDESPETFNEAIGEMEGYAKADEAMSELWPAMEAFRCTVHDIYEKSKGDDRKGLLTDAVKQYVAHVQEKLSALAKRSSDAKEGDPVDAELKKTIDELTKQTAETNGALKTLKADLDKERAENAELRKRLAGVKPTEKPDDTPVTKADLSKLDAESREAIEKAMKESADSRKEIAELRATAALNMETARIEKQYPNIVEEKAIKFAKLLLKTEKGSEDREAIEQLLEAANSQAEEILSEHGTSIEKRYSAAGGDPLTKIQTAAEEIRKADPKLNRAQAFSLARKRNPELARQLREES